MLLHSQELQTFKKHNWCNVVSYFGNIYKDNSVKVFLPSAVKNTTIVLLQTILFFILFIVKWSQTFMIKLLLKI